MPLLTKLHEFREQLEYLNTRIKSVEKSLHEEGASLIEYEKKYDDVTINGEKSQEVVFVWARNGDNAKRNRLMVRIAGQNARPLIECSWLNRIELGDLIDSFVSHLDDYIGDQYLNEKFDIDKAINGNK